jgi:hypothetical protein
MPLEKVDQLFGITSWKMYATFVYENIRYNGHKHLKELAHVTVASATEPVHIYTQQDQYQDQATYAAKKSVDPNDIQNIELVVQNETSKQSI